MDPTTIIYIQSDYKNVMSAPLSDVVELVTEFLYMYGSTKDFKFNIFYHSDNVVLMHYIRYNHGTVLLKNSSGHTRLMHSFSKNYYINVDHRDLSKAIDALFVELFTPKNNHDSSNSV